MNIKIVPILLAILFAFIILVVVLPLILSFFGVPILPSRDSGGSTGVGSPQAGLLRSADKGGEWQAPQFVREGRAALPAEILDVVFHPQDANILFAGTKSSALWKSEDQGATWKKVIDRAGALDAHSDVVKIALNRTRPKVMYVAAYLDNRGRVLRSEDGGETFSQVYLVTENRLEVLDIYTPPGMTDTITAAISDGRLIESRDGGKRWRIVRAFSQPVAQIAVNPVFEGEQYALTAGGGLFKTFDRGEIWADLTSAVQEARRRTSQVIEHPFSRRQGIGFLTSPRPRASFSIVISPHDPARLYLATREGLLSSSDGGFGWQKVETLLVGLETPLGDVAVHPTLPNSLLVAAGQNLYESTDGGVSWSVEVLPGRSSIKRILIHPLAPEVIFALLEQ